ncbi:MAG: hypothetical protein CR217_14410 [Beijerinckiaceae bacterium]|nr:MAG: hypothetical protein CR217_14410 [Beijerinckiaceae bacterium]
MRGHSAAVLDVNIDGEMFYSVADAVGARGVPFVFVTRYGVEGIDGRFAQVLVLQKPIERQMLQSVFLDGGHGSGKHCSDTQTVFDESMVLPNQIIRVFSRTVFKSAYRGCPQRISRAARGEARPPLPGDPQELGKGVQIRFS